MKAKLKYEDGWLVEMPTNGNAAMLLMEWASDFRMAKMPITKIINGDTFKIRFNITKIEIEKCVKYINDNL